MVSADSALTSPQPASPKDQVYSCDQCGHEASVTVELKKHKAEVLKNSAYNCNQCGLEDAGTANLKKHKKQSYKDLAYSLASGRRSIRSFQIAVLGDNCPCR